jgi:hypothetical protein
MVLRNLTSQRPHTKITHLSIQVFCATGLRIVYATNFYQELQSFLLLTNKLVLLLKC